MENTHTWPEPRFAIFQKCDKRQGVDYTDTELDFHFGRMKTSGIDSLDNNIQGDPFARTYEDTARKMYRKWDNVKHVSDIENAASDRVFRTEFLTGVSKSAKPNASTLQ